MNVTGSIFDFEGMGMLNWTDQMKSYNCRWLEPKYDPEHPPPPPGPPTPYPENPDNHLASANLVMER
jgi:hypothetical protein